MELEFDDPPGSIYKKMKGNNGKRMLWSSTQTIIFQREIDYLV